MQEWGIEGKIGLLLLCSVYFWEFLFHSVPNFKADLVIEKIAFASEIKPLLHKNTQQIFFSKAAFTLRLQSCEPPKLLCLLQLVCDEVVFLWFLLLCCNYV